MDIIELVAVATIKVIPHRFMRLKASMIFAIPSLALVAIPDVAVAIRNPYTVWSFYEREMFLVKVFDYLVETVNSVIILILLAKSVFTSV